MIIRSPQALMQARLRFRCEWCKAAGPVCPHHLKHRGMGGGSRLDVRINLIALCQTDHDAYHAGHILRADLLAVVAQREDCLQDEIETVIGILVRLPKEPRPERILEELRGVTKREREMAWEILRPWVETE